MSAVSSACCDSPSDARLADISSGQDDAITYLAHFSNGKEQTHGSGAPRFRICVRDEAHLQKLLQGDDYSAALAFIRGEYEIHGDIVAAVKLKLSNSRHDWKSLALSAAARLAPRRIETLFQTRQKALRNIRFHYDRSNAFYRCFLDSRMVYSCAYFKERSWSLEQAQLAKLDYLCRKLDLQVGERFLDIGCGWGGLVIHATERFGASSTGCTLSREQFTYAAQLIADRGLQARAEIFDHDYRDLIGNYEKIASVGMFEHVGRGRLRSYFSHIYSLLDEHGLFLNHGIVRPESVADDPQTLFLQRRVFPGGELPHLSDLVAVAEDTGFEILDVEDLRPHYALTCRRWVSRLQKSAEECMRLVGQETYRTWLLYLSGSAASFDSGGTSVYQTLMKKRKAGFSHHHLTREYMYTADPLGLSARPGASGG
jgi:cyclopropane-fatty-acyl-phospholipid synthase